MLTGCDLQVDANLIKPSSMAEDAGSPCQGAECPPGDGDGGADGDADGEPDAGDHVEPDAGDHVEPDAGGHGEPDAGGDGDVNGDAQVSCTGASCMPCAADDDCSADHYCSAIAGGCAPRDDEALGRAGPRVLKTDGLITDCALALGDQLYWGTYNARFDNLGNPLGTGEIWSWDGAGEAVRVASGFEYPAVKFARDGYLYVLETSVQWNPLFEGSTGDLLRVPLSGQGATGVVAVDAFAGWQTENYVWWSAAAGANVQLWRMATPSGAPELVSSGSHRAWLAGSETAAYWPEYEQGPTGGYHIVQHTFATAGTERVFGASYGDILNLRIDDGYAYFIDHVGPPGIVVGVELSHDDQLHLLGGASETISSYDLQYGWVYWINDPSLDTKTQSIVIARRPRDASGPRELIAELPNIDSGSVLMPPFAVGASKIFYYHPDEQRFYAMELPPLPCSGGQTCPATQTCGQDFLCH